MEFVYVNTYFVGHSAIIVQNVNINFHDREKRGEKLLWMINGYKFKISKPKSSTPL